MTTIKILKSFLTLVLALAIFSCNNSESSTDTATTDSTAMTESTPPAPTETAAMPALAAPFDVAEITHKIKDYTAWKPVFDADSANRIAAGLEFLTIGRNMNDPNSLILVFKADDVAKAKAMMKDPKLKDAMEKGGVLSKPEFDLWHVIRFNPDSHEKQWMQVTHKVKNFDAWLKVYDDEGTAQRANEGMADVALARGIDDSSKVLIVFDVSDMAKAKAAVTSDAKKKLMMSAGVEGKPSIEFYSEPK